MVHTDALALPSDYELHPSRPYPYDDLHIIERHIQLGVSLGEREDKSEVLGSGSCLYQAGAPKDIHVKKGVPRDTWLHGC